MTPEQIKEEQEASKANPIQEVKGKDASSLNTDTSPTNLAEAKDNSALNRAKAINEVAPEAQGKQLDKVINDYDTVNSYAKAKGIDINQQQGVPLLDKDKEAFIEKVQKAAPVQRVNEAIGRINFYAKPDLEKVPALDQKVLLERERQKRKARWEDALYAFGEGLQGRVANPETFATNRIQRKTDQEFQNYLDVTNRNRLARNKWNDQVSDDTLKWLDQQARNEQLDKFTRDKMAEAARQFALNYNLNNDKAKENHRHNVAMENKKTGKALENQLPVVIKTSKQTYTLKPEEANQMRDDVLRNADQYKSKYPGLFEIVQYPETIDDMGNIVPGRSEYKINSRIKDSDLIRLWLEENKEGGNQKITPQNQAAYFDKYRKAKGQPTSDIPVSETVKAGSPQTQYSQPQSTSTNTQNAAKKPTMFQ